MSVVCFVMVVVEVFALLVEKVEQNPSETIETVNSSFGTSE